MAFYCKKIWSSSREKTLLAIFLAGFTLACLIEIQFPLPTILRETIFDEILTNQPLQRISSTLFLSLSAAYIFYILIDFLPRIEKEKSTYLLLNSLLASILDAYHHCNRYGHELPINLVDKSVLDIAWLTDQEKGLRQKKCLLLPLKYAMETAHSRLNDFRDVLPLATSLSPDHALTWLVIIDKVRLLADNYGTQPPFSLNDEQFGVDSQNASTEIKNFKYTLNLRLHRYIESIIQWKSLN